jgi:hypothetical protein
MSLTREICSVCGNVVRIGFYVPDDIWSNIIPYKKRNDNYCLDCFTKIADETLIEWDKSIKFFPVSLKTHLSKIE